MPIGLLELGVALSGWATFAYDRFLARPRIRGRSMSLVFGEGQTPAGPRTLCAVYLYVENQSRTPVHFFDFRMEVFHRGDWVRLERLVGSREFAEKVAMHGPDGSRLVVPGLKDRIIDALRDTPAELGKPIQGWIFFFGPPSLHRVGERETYRATCVDVFDRRYSFEFAANQLPSLELLEDYLAALQPKALPEPTTPAGDGKQLARPSPKKA